VFCWDEDYILVSIYRKLVSKVPLVLNVAALHYREEDRGHRRIRGLLTKERAWDQHISINEFVFRWSSSYNSTLGINHHNSSNSNYEKDKTPHEMPGKTPCNTSTVPIFPTRRSF